VLAGSTESALQGAALLGVYSLGLAVPFVLAGAVFTRAMGTFRWLRDHYRAIQFAGGAVLVALGLLLFFERFYWLRIYVNRFLEWVGLEPAF
jgi:cytochrome c-type biogenesis protein